MIYGLSLAGDALSQQAESGTRVYRRLAPSLQAPN